MSTHRPYRFAPGHQAACDEIKAGRGSRYDAYVVDAFLRYINQAGHDADYRAASQPLTMLRETQT
jgi:HD-GYP domain-containing protein (c-di-GMP phosphodiesterase class II)